MTKIPRGAAACLAVVLLAGCMAQETANNSSLDGQKAALPDPIHREIGIGQGMDGIFAPIVGSCQLQPWCFSYPFNTTGLDAVNVAATLIWGLQASDFDLVIWQGDAEVARAASHSPGTEEHLHLTVGPGEYEVQVIPYLVPRDDATLDVTFALGDA